MSSVVELRRDLSLHFVAGEGVAAQAVPVQLAFTAHPSHPSEVAVFASARAQDGAEARRVLTATARTDTSRRLIGLHSQSTACLHRFGPEDLIYFWADYGTRVDLLAVKVGFEDAFDTSAADSMDAEGHPGEALRRSVPPIQCSNCEVLYSLDVAHHLTATSSSAKVDTNAIRLVKVEVILIYNITTPIAYLSCYTHTPRLLVRPSVLTRPCFSISSLTHPERLLRLLSMLLICSQSQRRYIAMFYIV